MEKRWIEMKEDELIDLDGGCLTEGAILGILLFVEGVALGAAWAFCD